MAIAGRVAIVPKGDWSAETEYKRLDEVTYNNTMFIAKKAVPKGTLPTNAEYWSKSIVGGVGAIATKEDAGIVKPADGLSIAEDGTLKVSIDGTTLTMDQVNNVIKLADTLKEKIGSALQPESIVNNQITTVEGFALDARQANPDLDGTLAKQISDLNGSLNSKINSLNPSNAIRSYKRVGYLATSGGGWYRFAEIIFTYDTTAKGSECQCIEATIRQTFNNSLGCFHKVSLYLIYDDRAKMTVVGQGTNVLTKVRAVRKDNIIYLDVYSSTIKNETEFLINIPLKGGIMSARCIDINLVPETSDGELIVCSVNFATNI